MTSRTLAKRLIALAKRPKTLAKSLVGEITAIQAEYFFGCLSAKRKSNCWNKTTCGATTEYMATSVPQKVRRVYEFYQTDRHSVRMTSVNNKWPSSLRTAWSIFQTVIAMNNWKLPWKNEFDRKFHNPFEHFDKLFGNFINRSNVFKNGSVIFIIRSYVLTNRSVNFINRSNVLAHRSRNFMNRSNGYLARSEYLIQWNPDITILNMTIFPI